MLNKVCLMGNLGKDPEMRKTQDGRPVANMSIATSEKWRDKSTGERKEKTEWHRVVCFSEGLCGVIEQYVRKGSTIYIEGKLQTRKWTDKDGVEKYSTEVVMNGFDAKLILMPKGGGRNNDAGGDDDFGTDEHSGGGGSRPRRTSAPRGRHDDMDDDIPFAAEFR